MCIRDSIWEYELNLSPEEIDRVLMHAWELGWKTLLDSISALKPEDIEKTVTIRSQPHTVLQAINRALAHLAYHTGQIVYLAKYFRSESWTTLSVPRGKTDEFNARMREKHSSTKV